MKIKTLIASSLLIVSSGIATAQATESGAPALLSALPDDAASLLSADESADTRGEKVTVKLGGYKVCKWGYCVSVGVKYKSFWVPYGIDGKYVYMVDY